MFSSRFPIVGGEDDGARKRRCVAAGCGAGLRDEQGDRAVAHESGRLD
jgi:hypothetical protein